MRMLPVSVWSAWARAMDSDDRHCSCSNPQLTHDSPSCLISCACWHQVLAIEKARSALWTRDIIVVRWLLATLGRLPFSSSKACTPVLPQCPSINRWDQMAPTEPHQRWTGTVRQFAVSRQRIRRLTSVCQTCFYFQRGVQGLTGGFLIP